MVDQRPAYERSHPCAIAEIERLRAALKEAREVLGMLDHPNDGQRSALDMGRGGKTIRHVIDQALEQSHDKEA